MCKVWDSFNFKRYLYEWNLTKEVSTHNQECFVFMWSTPVIQVYTYVHEYVDVLIRYLHDFPSAFLFTSPYLLSIRLISIDLISTKGNLTCSLTIPFVAFFFHYQINTFHFCTSWMHFYLHHHHHHPQTWVSLLGCFSNFISTWNATWYFRC